MTTSNAVQLRVANLAHVPSKKNKHYPSFGGHRVLMDKKTKAWLDQCILSFESQLRCLSATPDAGIWTEQSARSSIASYPLPADDCWQQIPEIHVTMQRCSKGHEGAHVTVEQLT